MKTILDALQFSCEKKKVYPKIGVMVFRFWVLILDFVGMQLAWNLRPFIGSRELPFQLFRERQGNFYLAVIESAVDLVTPSENKSNGQSNQQKDSTSQDKEELNEEG